MVRELWGGDNVDWSYSDALGESDGLLKIWNKDVFDPLYSFRDEGYMGMCIEK